MIEIQPFNLDRNNPASRYRGFNLNQLLNECGHKSVLKASSVETNNGLVVFGNYSTKGLDILQKLQEWQRNTGGKLIFDFADDMIGNLRRAAAVADKKNIKRLYNLESRFIEIISNSDYVTVSSIALMERYKIFNERIACISDLVDPFIFRDPYSYKEFKNNSPIKLFWTGYKDNVPVLEMIEEQLSQLARKYPRRFEVVVMTSRQRTFKYKGTKDNKELVGKFKFPSIFIEWTIDNLRAEMDKAYIALAPVLDDAAKSTNKVVTYMARGIPVVASNTADYAYALGDAGGGVLCKGKNDWYDAIDNLISNSGQRDDFSWNARQRALSEFNPIKVVRDWLDVFESFE